MYIDLFISIFIYLFIYGLDKCNPTKSEHTFPLLFSDIITKHVEMFFIV